MNSKTAKQQNSKTSQLVFLIFSLFFLSLSSCDKENFNEKTDSKKTKGFRIRTYGNSGENSRGLLNKILSFDSEEEYYTTLDSLNQVFENYQLEFQEKYKEVNDENLNELIISERIDLELPLTEFETKYNFTSLRNNLNEKEALWLNQPEPDFENSPQIFPIEDHVERTLWNENGEIMIGGKIYKYEDDRFIKIEDGDFEKLELINSGDLNIFSNENIYVENLTEVNSSSSNYICKRNNNKSTTKISNGLVKVRLVCANRIKSKSWEFGKHKMTANSYSYVKFNEGSWRKYVCTIKVSMTGFKYFGCSTSSPVNHSKERRANNVGVSHKRDNAFSVRYLNDIGSMKSNHAAISTPGIPSVELNNLSY